MMGVLILNIFEIRINPMARGKSVSISKNFGKKWVQIIINKLTSSEILVITSLVKYKFTISNYNDKCSNNGFNPYAINFNSNKYLFYS